jgi:Mrp family chromosome partitioning ATPase
MPKLPVRASKAWARALIIDQLKKQAASTNNQDVQLRALEREARAQRELLESYLARFREATTRENLESGPNDARIISRAIVSNTPAYPKKLPIVLIATLATLMLSAGSIVTGELLRMTSPRGPATVVAARPAPARAPAPAAAAAVVAPAAPAVAPQIPPAREERHDPAAPASDLGRIAAELRALGDAARKISVMGVSDAAGTSLTALTLARVLGRDSGVVLVDMSRSSTVRAVMADPSAPGLSDLVAGTASFGQIIGKDRMSRVQIIGSGTDKVDAAMLQSARLGMTIDALMRVYDHVILDAGSLDDIPEQLVATNAHAVLIATGLDAATREVISKELLGAGFRGVTMLDAPADPSQLGQPGGRMVAA